MKTREQAAEEHFPFQNPDQEIQFISVNDIAKECHAAFLAGCEFEAQNRWIPVSERLPETKDDVLCAMPNYKGDKYIQFVGCIDEVWVKREVTHWQPLPSSPLKPQEL